MDIIDLSTVPGSPENFEEFIDQLCRRLGVEYGSYATMNPMTGAVQGYATYGQAWKQHYMSHNLHHVMSHNLHHVDPTIHRAALSIAPVDWSRFVRDVKFEAVYFCHRYHGSDPRPLW